MSAAEVSNLLNFKPPAFVVLAFIFFMSLGIGLIVLRQVYGPDPFRHQETVDCILRERGKASYVCPDPR